MGAEEVAERVEEPRGSVFEPAFPWIVYLSGALFLLGVVMGLAQDPATLWNFSLAKLDGLGLFTDSCEYQDPSPFLFLTGWFVSVANLPTINPALPPKADSAGVFY